MFRGEMSVLFPMGFYNTIVHKTVVQICLKAFVNNDLS